MSNTITAIYRTADVAELVRTRLSDLGVPGRHSHLVGGGEREGEIDTLHLPDDETMTYKQAVRQGHFVVSAEVEEQMTQAAVEAMRHPEEGVDIDAYEDDYRGSADYEAHQGEAQSVALAEERLTVGKRVSESGSAHVRTYVQEVPVEERVRLREERLTVDRRAVDRVVTGAEADSLFEERDLEVTTRSEEAVVGKETVVTEEVVIGKEVTEREEVVNDTVRKTDVEVDRGRG